MTISDIYEKFGIPPNLREHMTLVAKLCQNIADHWVGENLNKDVLNEAAQLHDLGNVVKFDLDKHPEFLGEEQSRVEYWKRKQAKVINKYGKDDHHATEKMLKEVGVSQQVIDIIQNKSFGNSIQTAKSGSWELKILSYADMRVLPTGLSSLEDRLNDVVTRIEKYRNHPQKLELMDACRQIEKDILSHLNVSHS